jgi:hypothetical protein
MSILLGRRRSGGRWEILDQPGPERIRPEGAWDTLLVVEAGIGDEPSGGLKVTEYVVPPLEWREIKRPA